MTIKNIFWKETRIRKKPLLSLFIAAFFILNTTFVFAEGKSEEEIPKRALPSQAAFQEFLEALGQAKIAPSPNSPRGRMAGRILSLPFRDDVVYDVRVGYGVTIELLLPEEVENLVPPDENLVSADFVKNKAYLKGIAYAVGEATNLHVNTLSGTTLHLRVKIVEPDESDHAFKFILPSREVFSGSHVQKEVRKEKEKLEREIKKREENLEKVTDQMSEEKLKVKLLREAKVKERRKLKAKDLDIRDFEVSRIGDRIYVKFSLRNKSKQDFPLGQILLMRGIPDPKDSDKVLGFDPVEIDSPTLEAQTVPAGESVKVLLAFDRGVIREGEKTLLKVVEEGGAGRVLEFKEVPIISK